MEWYKPLIDPIEATAVKREKKDSMPIWGLMKKEVKKGVLSHRVRRAREYRVKQGSTEKGGKWSKSLNPSSMNIGFDTYSYLYEQDKKVGKRKLSIENTLSPEVSEWA